MYSKDNMLNSSYVCIASNNCFTNFGRFDFSNSYKYLTENFM